MDAPPPPVRSHHSHVRLNHPTSLIIITGPAKSSTSVIASPVRQIGRITGTVLQAVTLIPLHNALIEVIGTQRVTKTDDKGFFTLTYRKKSFVTLRITLEGHNTYTSQLITSYSRKYN